nr:hypothetical protein [Tanacetum cinerariifolium]
MIELDGATSMRKASVKSDKLYLSSGSSTQILDDPQIPALHALLLENRLLSIPTTLRLRKEHWKTCLFRLGTERTIVKIDDMRFHLELYISDKTASTIVVMFDEPEKELLKCFADSLAAADDKSGFGYADHAGLPLALANIIGTTHALEMKSHTYYEHGTFESFTCWRIAPEEVVDVDSESSNMNTSAEVNITEVKRLATKPFVTT